MKVKTEVKEVKVTELERRIGETCVAYKIGSHFEGIQETLYVRDFLAGDVISRIARTVKEYLRERLVSDDD